MPNEMIPVKFHEDTIFYTEKDGEMYVPVKPIVENLGLSWGTQGPKLSENAERYGYLLIKIPSKGGLQDTGCIPFRKVTAFLYSINVNKVREDLREKLTRYQNECDEVLWQYWTTGKATRESVRNSGYSLEDKLAAARLVFETAKLEGNQLALAVDKIYRREVGFSALQASDTVLVSPKREIVLTPTEIGEQLDPVLSPRVVNTLLAEAGYQEKIAKQWSPLPKAEGMYELQDTNKKHSNGTPIKQLKWYRSIVDVVRALVGQQSKEG